MLRQAQRELSKTDPFIYGEYVFGYEPADHHRQMVEFVNERIEKGENGVVLAPRGSAKTTWVNTIDTSWQIATKPDLRVGLFSQKDKKAEAMSGAIQWTISENENFKSIFGDLRHPAKWTAGEWLRKDSPWSSSKDRTVVAGGANSSSAVSKRFDLILCDDILDENNTYTLDQREKIETWFWKSLKPTLVPGGSIIVIGTRWTEGDLYEKLIEVNKWPSLVIKAIERDEDTAEERSYWPAVWPIDRLYAEREDVGWDNFACSYLNDISGLREGTIFRREWWEHSYFDHLPADRKYTFTVGVDLASSVRERADFTAAALVAQDDRHEHWVLHHERIKTDGGHREFVVGFYNWAVSHGYPVSKIVVETNQHQATFVQDLLRETNLPVVGRRADVDKRVRARAAATRYESRRVHHHVNIKGRELETEMTNFDRGHDDLIDALGLAMDIGVGVGAIAAVTAPVRDASNPLDDPRRDPEMIFIDGRRFVPQHVAEMLRGIDTTRFTFAEAMAQANQHRLNAYVKAQMGSFLGR